MDRKPKFPALVTAAVVAIGEVVIVALGLAGQLESAVSEAVAAVAAIVGPIVGGLVTHRQVTPVQRADQGVRSDGDG